MDQVTTLFEHARQVAAGPGVLVTYVADAEGFATTHEAASRAQLGERLAGLMGLRFAGAYQPGATSSGPLYFLPSDTIVGIDVAARLGIRSEEDLFGGVVARAFMRTKAITHPLVDGAAARCDGWCEAFPEQVRGVVLTGYSAFSRADAIRAAEQLAGAGGVRLKTVCATGGVGQQVVCGRAALEAALDAMSPDVIARDGVVLEENLMDVVTYSVGQVRIPGVTISYVGTQRLTPSNHGNAVYGGSELTVVRGGYAALAALGLPREAQTAAVQAAAYDAAADALFQPFLVSRRNYDIAQGRGSDGSWRSGVLEQSWRAGGASAAEVAAMERFQADPGLQAVEAATVEIYSPQQPAPEGAIVAFSGTDERVGPMLKYSTVRAYGDPR